MKTVIKNGLVVTFVNEGYHSIKMKHADILIEDDRIADIREEINEEGTVIDAKGKMVMPGFVNLGSHCIAAKLLNGLIPDYARHNWQGTMNYHRIQPMLKIADELLSYEEKCDLARWAIYDAISCGSTTLVDLNRPGFADAVTHVAKELGVRTWVVSMSTAGEFPTALQDGHLICCEPEGGHLNQMAENSDIVTRLDGLYSLETTSEEMWDDARMLKEKQPLLLYSAYSHYENQVSRLRYGKSPVAVANDKGVLSHKTVLLNSFYTDFFDRERLRTAGANMSFSAVSAMQDGLTLPIVTMLKQNINTALGTGYYGLSMLDEMKAAAFSGKLETGMAQQYQASDAFYAATVAGAQALGEPIGRIEPGLYADLLIVNVDKLRPLNYPLINFVYGGQQQYIETIIVAGQVISSTASNNSERIHEAGLRAQHCAEKVWSKARESIL